MTLESILFLDLVFIFLLHPLFVQVNEQNEPEDHHHDVEGNPSDDGSQVNILISAFCVINRIRRK